MTDKAKCPKCGSAQLEVITEHKTQGVSGSQGCCGAICLGPIGLLCSLCGAGKSHSKAKRLCMKCGKKF